MERTHNDVVMELSKLAEALEIHNFGDVLAKIPDNDYSEWYAQEDENYRVSDCDDKVRLHESIEFDSKPEDENVVEDFQIYLLDLLRIAKENAGKEKEIEDYNFREYLAVAKMVLTIDGSSYCSEDERSFLLALFNKLPYASAFKVDVHIKGYITRFAFVNRNKRAPICPFGFVVAGSAVADMPYRYKRNKRCLYKYALYSYKYNEYGCEAWRDGKRVDDETDDVLSFLPQEGWTAGITNIVADFNYEKHPDIVEKLHVLARSTFEGSDLTNCENFWEDESLGCVCDNDWYCQSLREVQDYLDKVNEILHPIMDEVKGSPAGIWVAPESFACACVIWTDEGFKIVGQRF